MDKKTSLRFKKMKCYRVTFLDNSVGPDGPAMCNVVGWLIENHRTHIVMTFWLVESKDKDMVEQNLEKFSILKSTIIKSRLLG
jgi:hypothetical protein